MKGPADKLWTISWHHQWWLWYCLMGELAAMKPAELVAVCAAERCSQAWVALRTNQLRSGDTYPAKNAPSFVCFQSVNALGDYFAVDWTEGVFSHLQFFPSLERTPIRRQKCLPSPHSKQYDTLEHNFMHIHAQSGSQGKKKYTRTERDSSEYH